MARIALYSKDVVLVAVSNPFITTDYILWCDNELKRFEYLTKGKTVQ
ncbi:hypothetical protein BS78_10G184500 [Paspalum vaginatum]|nr:hypothetical protein BS78_10G184500 [Paspalum vaginatum]